MEAMNATKPTTAGRAEKRGGQKTQAAPLNSFMGMVYSGF